MFEALFTYAKVLRRHQEGSSADEREQYLRYCANWCSSRYLDKHRARADGDCRTHIYCAR
jgi:hypothetical protein